MSNNNPYNTPMKLINNPLLKPLFTAIARLPLIGPHGDAEVDLLRGGAKPVGLFNPDDPAITELQSDIDAGLLIRRDVLCARPRSMTVYATAGTDMNKAAEAAIFYMQLNNATEAHPPGRAAFQELAQQGSIRELNHPKEDFAAAFLDGQHSILLVPGHSDKALEIQNLATEFKRRVADGIIVARKVECIAEHPFAIIGQQGREQDMENLAIILRDGYAGKPVPAAVENDSEGRILGYSDRDIAAYADRMIRQKEMNWLLRKTHDHRRDLRIALMKEAGPNWSRNP